ncbi:MAG: hypothetical protein LBC70_09585 [Chitinispirillales bacterium]|nr:hypothetical protein [Chitinispirillales bacterium]
MSFSKSRTILSIPLGLVTHAPSPYTESVGYTAVPPSCVRVCAAACHTTPEAVISELARKEMTAATV